MQLLLLLQAVGVQIGFCLSNRIKCTTNQTQSGTYYTIPQFNDSDCPFNWSNGSNHVIANSEMKNEFVEASSFKLHTKSCHKEIKYSRICKSEGEKMMATCFINCTSSVEPQRKRESDNKQPYLFKVWLIVGCVLLLLLLSGFLYKFRDNLSRWFRRCNRPETALNRQHGPPNEDDVEAQKSRQTFL